MSDSEGDCRCAAAVLADCSGLLLCLTFRSRRRQSRCQCPAASRGRRVAARAHAVSDAVGLHMAPSCPELQLHRSQARVRLLTAGPLRCAEEGLWLPNTERPAWLDGSLPGDRGFDPLGLSRPTEYLQVRPPLLPHHWHSRLHMAPCYSDRSQCHAAYLQSIIIATAANFYIGRITDFRCLPADPARCACQRARRFGPHMHTGRHRRAGPEQGSQQGRRHHRQVQPGAGQRVHRQPAAILRGAPPLCMLRRLVLA